MKRLSVAERRAARADEARHEQARRRRRLLGLALASAALLALVAVVVLRQQAAERADGSAEAGADVAARFARHEVADEPNADPSRVVWPDFVTRAGPEVRRLYEFNIANGDVMKYMPCFCGCHREDGHRNNRDCYVDAVKPDGTVVLDPMAPT